MSFFTGVVVPIGAVFIGWYFANSKAEEKHQKDEQIQRLKLLRMLQQELESVLDHYETEGKYLLRNSIKGQAINNSPVFNADDHKEFFNLLWKYMRGYESLNTAIEAIPTIFPKQDEILKLSKTFFIHDSRKYDKLYNEMNKHIDEILKLSVQQIMDAAKPLLVEVNNLILQNSNVKTHPVG
ncbi:hypothetical protein [Paenibacillus sp. DR312]|uniref:hypothetical protein n=1 Tax=Paenibacillus sp. DR312 TaxID=2871175 RepID=UPI001C97ABAD|nr:hypothetical protein [Paenibacillus sp. DR312]QZN75508.1 hypothetical protein K5K90_29820 [Paenibacillus sp. DR312]